MPSTYRREAEKSDNKGRQVRALIMKGGGIKGLAYVGAVEELEKRYHFDWFIGTSAGAIAAVLLGAGYSIEELQQILRNKDFKEFFDAKWYQKPLNLLFHRGLHRADALTNWLDELLAGKLNSHARVRLSQLPRRVTVYASQRHSSALTFDSKDADADAAYAARCSMSIPWVFTPQLNQGIRAYDGGIQNNYPVKKLTDDHPGVRFVSLYLGPATYQPSKSTSVLSDLVAIASEASDLEMITKHRDSTVIIDTRPLGTLDFSLSQIEKQLLVLAGRVGALKHLHTDETVFKEANENLEQLRTRVTGERGARARWTKTLRIVTGLATLAILASFFLLSRSMPQPGGADNGTDNGLSAPTANFDVSAKSGTAPLVVRFFDQSVGNISKWHWDFGDGKTSVERSPTHEYDRLGEFDVVLEVGSPNGAHDIARRDGLVLVKLATPHLLAPDGYPPQSESLLELPPLKPGEIRFDSKLRFMWQRVPLATGYRLEIEAIHDDNKWHNTRTTELGDVVSADLTVGGTALIPAFRWRVTATHNETGDTSEPSRWMEFGWPRFRK